MSGNGDLPQARNQGRPNRTFRLSLLTALTLGYLVLLGGPATGLGQPHQAHSQRAVAARTVRADLGVRVFSTGSMLKAGQSVTMVVAWVNRGSDPAQNTRIDLSTLGLTHLSTTGLNCLPHTCALGTIRPGATGIVRISGVAIGPPYASVHAAIRSSTHDPNPANNQATARIPVRR